MAVCAEASQLCHGMRISLKEKSKIFKTFTMLSQIGISMMVPIFLCVWLGSFLDEKFGTAFLFPIFLILGFLSAIRNVYILTRTFYAKDKAREDAELAYIENLKQEGRKKAKEQEKQKDEV